MDTAQAARPRYGLQCVVKTVQVDEKDFFKALLECKSELVNVSTKSARKSAVRLAAKQSGMELNLDLKGSQGSFVEIESIFIP